MKVTIREKILSTGHRSLFLDIYHSGVRKKEFLGLRLDGNREADGEKMRLAEMVRAKRELELFADEHSLVTVHRSKIGLVEYAKQYADKKQKSALSKAIPRIESFFGQAQLGSVSEKQIELFQESLRNLLMDSTVETYISALNAVFNRAIKENLIARSPMIGVKKIRAQEAVIKSLTDEELQILVRTPIPGERTINRAGGVRAYGGKGAILKRMFIFSCNTGLRWSDVRSLTWSKIRGRQIERIQSKTDGVIYIPINDQAWEQIKDYFENEHKPDEKVFPWGESKTNPDDYMEKWGRKAGVPFRLGFHVSRHTFARRLLETGADIVTVQNLLGHKKIENTARYGKASSRQKKDAVDRL